MMGIGIGGSHGTRLLEHEDSPSQLALAGGVRGGGGEDGSSKVVGIGGFKRGGFK
jgi:hypothetical protein